MTKKRFNNALEGFKQAGYTDFQIKCLDSQAFIEIWENAEGDRKAFEESILNDKQLMLYQGGVELLKNNKEYQSIVLSLLRDAGKSHFVSCDSGGVRLGNDGFSAVFNNLYGDGTTNVIILPPSGEWPGEFHSVLIGMFLHQGMTQGDCSLYSHDSDGDAIASISGRAAVMASSMFYMPVVVVQMLDKTE